MRKKEPAEPAVIHRLFNVNEIAEKTGMSARTLRGYVEDGYMPYTRIRGRILFDEAEIVKWLEDHKVAPFREKVIK